MEITVGSSDYVARPQIPWRDIYNDLFSAGISVSHLARILGRRRTTIQYWLKDAPEPDYSHGYVILTYHARVCGEALTRTRIPAVKQGVVSTHQ